MPDLLPRPVVLSRRSVLAAVGAAGLIGYNCRRRARAGIPPAGAA